MGKRPIDGRLLVDLKNKISPSFSSSEWLELGTITDCFELVDSHHRLLQSLRFNDDDYEGHVLSVLRQMVQQDPDNLVKIQDYVRRVHRGKAPESGDDISSHKEPGRRIVFAPSVFNVPDGDPDPNLVAVMMPFDAAFNPVFTAITKACFVTDFDWQRADDMWEHSTVIQDIFSLIFRSTIVVCDFSGRNPNVFYEAGIAHTLGKHVIPLARSEDDIPFDLRHHRYLQYLNNTQGLEDLSTGLAKRLATLREK